MRTTWPGPSTPAATIKFISTMETVTVIYEGECQTVRLPKDFPLSKTTVGVRHEGETIVLEP